MKKVLLLCVFANFMYAQTECVGVTPATNGSVPVSATPNNGSVRALNSSMLTPGVSINSGATSVPANLQLSSFSAANISNGNQSVILIARFNPLTSKIEIKSGDDGQIRNLNELSGINVKFISDNSTYKAISHISKDGIEKIEYFKVSNNNLLKRDEYKFVKAKIASNSYAQDKPARYEKTTKYYFRSHNNSLIDLSLSKKTIAKSFPESSKEVLSFLRKNKINLKKEVDLIRLASFMSNMELDVYSNNGKLASN